MDNGNAPVQVPDFTRGHWNEQDGFRYAYATPEQEEQVDSISRQYTRTLKAGGPQAAEDELQNLLKQFK